RFTEELVLAFMSQNPGVTDPDAKRRFDIRLKQFVIHNRAGKGQRPAQFPGHFHSEIRALAFLNPPEKHKSVAGVRLKRERGDIDSVVDDGATRRAMLPELSRLKFADGAEPQIGMLANERLHVAPDWRVLGVQYSRANARHAAERVGTRAEMRVDHVELRGPFQRQQQLVL